MKKLIATVLCMVLLVLNLTGCTSQNEIRLSIEEEQVELTFSWWGSDDRHAYTIEAIKQFEEKYPNIKVNLEYSEFTGFQLKTDVKMRAGTEADVMQLNYAWIDRYSADGKGLYDLNQVSGNLNLNNYSKESLSYGYSANVLNALPIALNGKVFIYNKTIYEKYGLDIPKTWDDLFAAAQVMNQDGIYPLDLENSAVWFLAVAYVEQTTGKAVFDEENNLQFTKEDVQSMISFYTEMVRNGVVKEVSARSDSDISGGTAAGTVQWVTSAQKFGDYIKDAGGEIAYGDAPVLDGASRSGWYVKPATMYAISKNTAHPKEAALLLEFLVSSKEMATLQGVDKGIPANEEAKKTLDEEGLLTGIQYSATEILDETDTILMSPYFENSVYQNALKSACIDVLYEKSDLDTAAETAYQKMVAK